MTINPSDVSARLRQLVIMDEVGSDNPLGREAADLIDSQAKLLAEREWRLDLKTVPRDRDFLIQYDHGEVTIGHYLDNSKTKPSFEGIMPCRSLRPFRVGGAGERIVAWQELPRPTTEGDR